jgi:hypothetical protein
MNSNIIYNVSAVGDPLESFLTIKDEGQQVNLILAQGNTDDDGYFTGEVTTINLNSGHVVDLILALINWKGLDSSDLKTISYNL